MTTSIEHGIDLGPEYNDLTERQAEFVALAGRHADDFASRAAEHDREASYPFENFAAMHESGYARICLPEEFKGMAANMEDFCIAQDRLAQGCASTALSFNMHGFATGMQTELWRQGAKELEMPLRAVESGITFGGSLSEAESSNPFAEPAGRVERCDGGFKLNGRKVFGSNTPINPMVAFNGILEEDGQRRILMFQVPKETPGVKIIEDWDTLGMRGTGSYSIEFKDCVAPELMNFASWEAGGAPGENLFGTAFICWFGASIGAVYTGIGAGARNIARDAVANRSRIPHGPLKQYASVQYTLAEIYITIEAARGFYRRSARRLGNPAWRDERAVALSAATKHFGAESGKRAVDLAMEMVGGGAFFKRMPLERMYRDVRAGGFHPLNRYDAYEGIGKAELGIPQSQEPRFL